MPSSNPDLAHYFFHKLSFNHTNINRERERESMLICFYMHFEKKIFRNSEFQNIKSLMPKFDHSFI